MTIRAGLIVLLRMVCLFGFVYVLLFGIGLWALDLSGYPAVARFGIPAAWLVILILIAIIGRIAPFIVDCLGPKETDIVPETGFTTDNLQAVGFSILGLYFVVNASIDLFSSLVVFDPQQMEAKPMLILLRPVAGLLIGLYLVFGAPHIRRLVRAVRNAGLS